MFGPGGSSRNLLGPRAGAGAGAGAGARHTPTAKLQQPAASRLPRYGPVGAGPGAHHRSSSFTSGDGKPFAGAPSAASTLKPHPRSLPHHRSDDSPRGPDLAAEPHYSSSSAAGGSGGTGGGFFRSSTHHGLVAQNAGGARGSVGGVGAYRRDLSANSRQVPLTQTAAARQARAAGAGTSANRICSLPRPRVGAAPPAPAVCDPKEISEFKSALSAYEAKLQSMTLIAAKLKSEIDQWETGIKAWHTWIGQQMEVADDYLKFASSSSRTSSRPTPLQSRFGGAAAGGQRLPVPRQSSFSRTESADEAPPNRLYWLEDDDEGAAAVGAEQRPSQLNPQAEKLRGLINFLNESTSGLELDSTSDANGGAARPPSTSSAGFEARGGESTDGCRAGMPAWSQRPELNFGAGAGLDRRSGGPSSRSPSSEADNDDDENCSQTSVLKREHATETAAAGSGGAHHYRRDAHHYGPSPKSEGAQSSTGGACAPHHYALPSSKAGGGPSVIDRPPPVPPIAIGRAPSGAWLTGETTSGDTYST